MEKELPENVVELDYAGVHPTPAAVTLRRLVRVFSYVFVVAHMLAMYLIAAAHYAAWHRTQYVFPKGQPLSALTIAMFNFFRFGGNFPLFCGVVDVSILIAIAFTPKTRIGARLHSITRAVCIAALLWILIAFLIVWGASPIRIISFSKPGALITVSLDEFAVISAIGTLPAGLWLLLSVIAERRSRYRGPSPESES